ncbi:MAG: DedA family protein [Arthrobacter sp.]|uniref:DedA family protein n=1 Tax=unclassified Arthrobacter TaxID=235627 RepID=UPI0026550FB0|nr:DedA family protein [Micrococcaceae bacterium]MDN5824150.1 DedA family protein [Micrococcaceae bacterium]MDN5879501.1 DedA family protein [Micrococcaceae bacterium]MDN5885770.1 DedA family protein [Micrococcaceae bacterium]MDN5904095.1 DedA family protein [Micrococcaceae bacterium]
MEIVNEVILHASTAWWILPLLFLLCLIDGFMPVVPSESLLVALASVAVASGSPSLLLLGVVGAAGAMAGDQIAYGFGRRIGLDRFRWMRRPRTRRTFAFARRELERRGALLIFTARYIPVGRVAVNFTAGATRFSRRRFTLLDVLGCLTWSAYSTTIGAVGGHWMKDNPLLGIGLSIAIAMVFGFIVDRVLNVLRRRLGTDPQAPDAQPAPPLLEVPAERGH